MAASSDLTATGRSPPSSSSQIDAHADGDPLRKVAAGKGNISFTFPAKANHVLKEDTRTVAEITAAPGTGYNEPGTHLDPESLETILTWLHKVFAIA